MRSEKTNRTFLPSSKTNMLRFGASRGSSGTGRCSVEGVFISVILWLERKAHLRADNYRVGNVTGPAGIDNILDVRLEVTPRRELKAVRELDHLLRVRQMSARHSLHPRVVAADVAVNKVQHGVIAFAARE